MAFCTKCGAQQVDGVKFCTSCGQTMAAPAATAAPPDEAQTVIEQAPAYQPPAQQPPAYQPPQPGYPPPPPAYAPAGQGYSQPYASSPAPVGQLNTNRSLLKFILLSIITCGIYSIVFYYGISSDLNVIAGRYDGKKTMNYALLMFLIGPLTLGIAYFVWFHKMSSRMGIELKRRNIGYSIGAADFWLWGFLGALIIIGPFVYTHKLAKASNKLAEHYNMYG